MTGYCYRDTSMSLVHVPWLREFLYGLIVAFQAVPIAVVLLAFSPPAEATSSALFLARSFKFPFVQKLELVFRSTRQYQLAAYCLLFLISFQEADLASLMQASGWTEWMFTKHVGGLALRETMQLTLWPVFIQTPCLLPLIFWLKNSTIMTSSELLPAVRVHSLQRLLSYVWTIAALIFVLVIPGWQLLNGFSFGLGSLWEQPSIPREIGDALLIAGTTAACTLGMTFLSMSHSRKSGSKFRQLILLFLLLAPGGMGNLALGLLLGGIFQTDALNFAYDTPLPLIIGEIGLLLPRTMILLHCLAQMNHPSSQYVITLLEESPLHSQRRVAADLAWQTHGRTWFGVVALVGFWAYFEVMLPSILAMPGLAPIGLVLYNNLHYGRIAALGAKLVLALLVPLTIVTSILAMRKFLSRFS